MRGNENPLRHLSKALTAILVCSGISARLACACGAPLLAAVVGMGEWKPIVSIWRGQSMELTALAREVNRARPEKSFPASLSAWGLVSADSPRQIETLRDLLFSAAQLKHLLAELAASLPNKSGKPSRAEAVSKLEGAEHAARVVLPSNRRHYDWSREQLDARVQSLVGNPDCPPRLRDLAKSLHGELLVLEIGEHPAFLLFLTQAEKYVDALSDGTTR